MRAPRVINVYIRIGGRSTIYGRLGQLRAEFI